MMHTFLFEPGVWTSKGTFWRADGEPLEAQGRTEIAHHPAAWLLAGTLKVFGSPPVEFVNAYSISPPGRDGTCMKWTAENATLGRLSGTFSIVGTSILVGNPLFAPLSAPSNQGTVTFGDVTIDRRAGKGIEIAHVDHTVQFTGITQVANTLNSLFTAVDIHDNVITPATATTSPRSD